MDLKPRNNLSWYVFYTIHARSGGVAVVAEASFHNNRVGVYRITTIVHVFLMKTIAEGGALSVKGNSQRSDRLTVQTTQW